MTAPDDTEPVPGAHDVLVPPPAEPGLSRATLSDVARLTGVSAKTVSRVAAGHPHVSQETRARVEQAMRMLRFRPNHLARDLRRGAVSSTVAFVIGDLENPFYALVASGIERALAEHGLTMVLASTHDDPEAEARVVGAMLERRVYALLLVPIAQDQSYLEGERSLGTSIVCVDRPARNLAADSVVYDNQGGARSAVAAMIDAGHRRIGFIGNGPLSYTFAERLAGYRQALAEAGLPARAEWVVDDAHDAQAAARATRAVLGGPHPPTALLASNNRASTGVYLAVREHPHPIAFTGFDDFDLAEALGISVVAHDPAGMGHEAASFAVARSGQASAPVQQIVLPTRLIARGSGELPPAVG